MKVLRISVDFSVPLSHLGTLWGNSTSCRFLCQHILIHHELELDCYKDDFLIAIPSHKTQNKFRNFPMLPKLHPLKERIKFNDFHVPYDSLSFFQIFNADFARAVIDLLWCKLLSKFPADTASLINNGSTDLDKVVHCTFEFQRLFPHTPVHRK